MIWVNKDLDHWIEAEQPERIGDAINIDGIQYRRLTPKMFAAIWTHYQAKAEAGMVSKADLISLAQIEESLRSLNLWDAYYAKCQKGTE